MSWKAAHLALERPLWWRAAAGIVVATMSLSATASVLDYCHSPTESDAATQDRLIQVAAILKGELDRSGHRVALVARSGLALQRLNQRYSHAGVSLLASSHTPWAVRQLYYACDAARPRIFDQGMSGFVLGANAAQDAYISIVLMPEAASFALETVALDSPQALAMLGDTYSANAHPFSQRYQNCNQWLVELLASAWGPPQQANYTRGQAQTWLQEQGYQPSTLQLGWHALIWLAGALPWLHTDDHPASDLYDRQFRVSMPQSIEAFVRKRLPQSQRIELCHTPQRIVIRRGWKPIAEGCLAEDGDEVIASLDDAPSAARLQLL